MSEEKSELKKVNCVVDNQVQRKLLRDSYGFCTIETPHPRMAEAKSEIINARAQWPAVAAEPSSRIF